MRTQALILSLAIAGFGVTGYGRNGAAPGPPKDPCALLKPAEVQTLDPKAKMGSGVPSTVSEELSSFNCRYEWGTGGNPASGRWQLDITLTDASKAFPGTDPSVVKQGLLAQGKRGEGDVAVIPGVGEAAIFQSNAPIRAETTAYLKGSLLQVILEGPDARGKKDQVIALLKSAAARF